MSKDYRLSVPLIHQITNYDKSSSDRILTVYLFRINQDPIIIIHFLSATDFFHLITGIISSPIAGQRQVKLALIAFTFEPWGPLSSPCMNNTRHDFKSISFPLFVLRWDILVLRSNVVVSTSKLKYRRKTNFRVFSGNIFTTYCHTKQS